MTAARLLAREERMRGRFSAGANVAAAQWVATRLSPSCAVATLIPDNGFR